MCSLNNHQQACAGPPFWIDNEQLNKVVLNVTISPVLKTFPVIMYQKPYSILKL